MNADSNRQVKLPGPGHSDPVKPKTRRRKKLSPYCSIPTFFNKRAGLQKEGLQNIVNLTHSHGEIPRSTRSKPQKEGYVSRRLVENDHSCERHQCYVSMVDGSARKHKKKMNFIRKRIASGINQSMLNLTKHHKRVIEKGVQDVIMKNPNIFTKNPARSPNLVIDIRLLDNSDRKNSHVRRITPMGSNPVRFLRNRGNLKSQELDQRYKNYSNKKSYKPNTAYQSQGNILNLNNGSRVSTSPSHLLSSNYPKETAPTTAEKRMKDVLGSGQKSSLKNPQKTPKAQKLHFPRKSMKSPIIRKKTKRKMTKRHKSNRFESKEIGIFNIDEENLNETLKSKSDKGFRLANSPTPEPSIDKLEIDLDKTELKSEAIKQEIVNIQLPPQVNRPEQEKLKILEISHVNNSQVSNEKKPIFAPKKHDMATSPFPENLVKPVKVYREVAISTKDLVPEKFELKNSKLYQLFLKNCENFGELSEHVYSDYDLQNILSPHDAQTALSRVKMVIQRQEKGINEEGDQVFAKSYYKIGMATLEYLMHICSLDEYYQSIHSYYSEENVANSIKTLIRVRKMYKIIDTLESIFKLIKEKDDSEQANIDSTTFPFSGTQVDHSDKISRIISEEVGEKLLKGPFKMWIDAIMCDLKPESSTSDKEQPILNLTTSIIQYT